MIRWLFVRIVVPLLVILILRSVIVGVMKALSQAFAPAPPDARPAADSQTGGELKKDPVCGTYVSPGAAVSKRVKGGLVYFCSQECRDKYVAT
jgi:YHS domain-containing protein